jgi:subtilisin family serine protease
MKGGMALVESKLGILFRLCVLTAILLPAMTFAAQAGLHAQAGKKPLPMPAQGFRDSPRHILIKLDSRADVLGFLKQASKRGFNKLGRVYGSNWYTFSLPPQAKPREAVGLARTLPGVVMSTMDPIVTVDAIPPRDPLYRDDDDPSTKGCDPLEQTCDPLDLVDQWGLFKVEAESAWTATTGSNTVVIAVVDSGVDLDHDDLIGNIWTNPAETVNGIDDDGNGLIDDIHGADFAGDNVGDPYTDNVASQDANPDIPAGGSWVYDPLAYPYGIRFDGDPAVGDAMDNNLDGYPDVGVFHGTFVAGIIAAMTDNINPGTGDFEGMAGACWNCRIMPVRMINAEGNGYGSDAAAAIYYAVDMGANVINLSWGFDLDNLDPAGMAEVAVITDAINYAVSHGVVVVASAGNSGGPGLRFPASMANTIAIGSSNWLDHRSEFSTIANPGELPDNGIDDDGNGRIDDVLDVLAPGEYIWSSYIYSAFESLQAQVLGFGSDDPGTDAYGNSNGTSFSAPLVAGYVGLLLSRFPDATPDEIRQAVRSNAIDLLDPEGTGDNLPGYDFLSGFGRLRMVIPNDLSDPPPPPPSPLPPGPMVELVVDEMDTGQYGYNYGSDQHETVLAATFTGDGITPYELHVTGYDIDDATEVAVYLNGTRIGYLSAGPDNGLNTGDVFVLDPALQVAGENSIEFRERVEGWTWGVTNLGVLSPPPPPPEVTLALDVVDTGQYGQYYGSYQYGASVVAAFVGDGVTPYELHVTGYDIDDATEVAVYLNGTLIGYLSVGPNKKLNAGDVFVLDPALQATGENRIEFRERVSGSRWGVTNLGLFDLGTS